MSNSKELLEGFLAQKPGLKTSTTYTKTDKIIYTQFLGSLATQSCYKVLSDEFIRQNNISEGEMFMVLAGKDFNPKLMGYSGPVSTFTSFRFYMFSNKNRYKSIRRLFECTHVSEEGTTCGMSTPDMCKMFSHSAIHTK